MEFSTGTLSDVCIYPVSVIGGCFMHAVPEFGQGYS